MSTTYRRIGAVKTTADLLQFLSRQKEPVTGSAVAEGLGLPTATVMCHLVTLEDAGLVRKIADGYELGMKIMLFWAAYKSKLEERIARDTADLQRLNEGGNDDG